MPIEILVHLLSAVSLLLLGALLFGRRKRSADAELREELRDLKD
jgi:hypothetical protein